ncbi:hypothetical protein, partial [Methanosarcina acetivorans]|uniref:hypothetical protein n=1 Tax=Methanosarcina acetivorans TaxID=2214 RepID=UPI0024789D1F
RLCSALSVSLRSSGLLDGLTQESELSRKKKRRKKTKMNSLNLRENYPNRLIGGYERKMGER